MLLYLLLTCTCMTNTYSSAKQLTFDPSCGGYWAVEEFSPLLLRGSVERVRVHTVDTTIVCMHMRKYRHVTVGTGLCGYRYSYMMHISHLHTKALKYNVLYQKMDT